MSYILSSFNFITKPHIPHAAVNTAVSTECRVCSQTSCYDSLLEPAGGKAIVVLFSDTVHWSSPSAAHSTVLCACVRVCLRVKEMALV